MKSFNHFLLKKIKLFSPKTSKGAIELIFATVFGQLLSFAFSIPLSQYFLPSSFGFYLIVTSLVSLLSPVVSLKYDSAIIVPEKLDDSFRLVYFSMLVSLILIVPVISFTIFMQKYVNMKLLEGVKGIDFIIVAVSILFQITSNGLSLIAVKKNDMRKISISRIIQPLFFSATALIFGINGIQDGLVFAFVVGQGAFLVVLIWGEYENLINTLKTTAFADFEHMGKKYSHFPKYNLPHSLVDALQSSILVLVLTQAFGPVVLGYFSMANRVVKVPGSLVGGTISQVFLGKISQNRDPKYILNITKKITLGLLLIGAPFLIFACIFSESIFSYFYGVKWIQSGAIARYLAPYAFFTIVVSPLTQIPYILGKQKQSFYFGLATNGTYLLTLWISSQLGFNVYMSLNTAGVLGIVFIFVYSFWVFKILNVNNRNMENFSKI